jgi:decaprenyl-phosphate phosphoribosyltransferase
MSAPARERADVPVRPLPIRGSSAAAYLQTARPRQWIKNLLVFAAPAAAGVLDTPRTAVAAMLAFVAFTLAAVATYFLNDAADMDADRRHAVKSRRPIASGRIGRRTARLVGFGAAVAALGLAGAVSWPFGGCVAAYLVLTGAYTVGLKHIAVLDVLVVAGGFVLRTAGGAAATRAPVSSWFLLLTLFGSLFLVTAKRVGEQNRAGGAGRRVLTGYAPTWLQQILTMSLTGTVVAYAAWAFQYGAHDVALPVLAASLLPFLAALMRYSLLVSRGAGEVPENLVLGDCFLLVAGLVWAGTAGAAVYLA